MENLKRLSKSVGVEVEFTGKLTNDDSIRKMKEASIMALTSSRENFGIVPLEAMRCKTAVISTRTEGPVDYIEDGKNGFLVDIGNAEQVANRMDRLLSDGKLLSRIQKSGFETSARFDWEKIVGRIAALYSEIIQGK